MQTEKSRERHTMRFSEFKGHFIRILARGVVVAGLLVLALWQVAAGAAPLPVAAGLNFTASTYNVDSTALPPDPNGAIGPNHFVEFINGTFTVFDKTDGSNVKEISDLDFWGNAGLIISPDDVVTDPRVIYDSQSQRWFATMVDVNASASDPTLDANDFLLAVSATADPRGSWNGFKFQADPDHGDFADFPTMGLDANGVYISGDMFKGQNNPQIGPSLVAIPKRDLLLSTPTIANRTWFGVMSDAVRGMALQPATCFDGSENGMILSAQNYGTNSSFYSNLVTFAVQKVTNGPSATLSGSTLLPVQSYMVPDNADFGAPVLTPLQPDGTSQIQANDARFAARVYAVNGVLYAAHNTEYNGHIAIQWYRINAATKQVLEDGLLTNGDMDLFFPSIAANTNGTVVICCNGSSGSTFVSCYAFVGTTSGGVTTFNAPILLQSGVTDYHGDDEVADPLLGLPAFSRWGDYSTTSVDPNDSNIFWTIQMYPSDTDVWSTQVSQIITGPPELSIVVADGIVTVSWLVNSDTFTLESNTSLESSIWTPISPSNYTTNNGTVSYQEPVSASAKMFRLEY
jgi:hypothetical protein